MLELLFSALICVVEYSIFIMFLQHYENYVFSAYKWCKRNVQRIDIAISLVFIKCLASIRMLNFCGGMKI